MSFLRDNIATIVHVALVLSLLVNSAALGFELGRAQGLSARSRDVVSFERSR